MTDEDYARKLGEVDRVPNDPDAPIQPALIWRLLAEISEHDMQACTKTLTLGVNTTQGDRLPFGLSPLRVLPKAASESES